MLNACVYTNLNWQRSVLNHSRVQAALQTVLHQRLLAAGLLFNACTRLMADYDSLLESSGIHMPLHHAIHPPPVPLLLRATEPPLETRMLRPAEVCTHSNALTPEGSSVCVPEDAELLLA